MSLRSLYESGVEAILTGLLERELRPARDRFRPGGYDRALVELRSRMSLNRYDWNLVRNQIGPSVRREFWAAIRARDTPDVPIGRIPISPAPPEHGEQQYGYVVRYRQPGDIGGGRRDVVFPIHSDRPLSAEEVREEAVRQIQEEQVRDTMTAGNGDDPLDGTGDVIILRIFRNR